MIGLIKSKVSGIKLLDSQRSKNVFRNIFLSFGARGGSIVVSLLLVPMTINYVSPIQYGVWLTISSIVSWMNFFDIGLGNGLRNKLTVALAAENYVDAKKFVSTAYVLLTIISGILFVLILAIIPNVDWRPLLNVPPSVGANITTAIFIVFSSFCVQFVLQLLNTVLTATHQPSKAAFLSFLGQLGMLIVIYILTLTVPGNLVVLVAVLTLIPILVLLVSSVVLYRTTLRPFSPSIKYFELTYAKSVMQVGGSFFFVQIGALVLFQSNNIIISKILGPEHVTEFNVAFKLFSVVTMASTIIITPFWSAFTDAFAKGDYAWMKKNIRTVRLIWLALSLVSIGILFCADWLYKLWVGDTVSVESKLSLAMAIYVIVSMWQTMHVYLLNGIGKIRLQLYLVSVTALINIPLSIYLGTTYGLSGIISANTMVFAAMGVLFYIQVEKILANKATGIWGK